jgi:hypothetical protein
MRRGLAAGGRNLPKSTREIAGIVSARGIIHVLKSANAVPIGASKNSRPILAIPKDPFSAGTQTALRSPTRTLSSIVKIAVLATASTSTVDSTASRRSGEVGDAKMCMTIKDIAASSTDALVANA